MMRKALYFGLGALSITRDHAERFFAEMVEKGEISREEAKSFVDEAIKRGEEEKVELRKSIRQEVEGMKKSFSYVTKSELGALEKRIRLLEEKMGVGIAEEQTENAED